MSVNNSIPVQFNGEYESSVDTVGAMDGVLTVPASANPAKVEYILNSEANTTYLATPTFTGNLIKFSFATNGIPSVTFTFEAKTWTPSATGGGQWDGEGVSSVDPTGQTGNWKAKT